MQFIEQDNLLKGLKNNNEKAINTIYKLAFPLVKAYIVNNNGSLENAQDIFQEAMIVLFQKVNIEHDFKLSCSISTYIYEVCRRLWLKQLTKKNQKNQLSLTQDTIQSHKLLDIDFDFEEHEKYNTNLDKMQNALSQIGEPCSSILKAFYIENKSMIQISQDFGYTNENNAKTQKYKCLMRLKKIFFNEQ